MLIVLGRFRDMYLLRFSGRYVQILEQLLYFLNAYFKGSANLEPSLS